MWHASIAEFSRENFPDVPTTPCPHNTAASPRHPWVNESMLRDIQRSIATHRRQLIASFLNERRVRILRTCLSWAVNHAVLESGFLDNGLYEPCSRKNEVDGKGVSQWVSSEFFHADSRLLSPCWTNPVQPSKRDRSEERQA